MMGLEDKRFPKGFGARLIFSGKLLNFQGVHELEKETARSLDFLEDSTGCSLVWITIHCKDPS